MRMGVLFGGTTMSGPTGVSDAVGAIQRFIADDLFQIAQFALGAPDLQSLAIAGDCDSGRVVAAVLESPETFDDDRDDLLFPHVSDDATHVL